jgi:hypothetical protein
MVRWQKKAPLEERRFWKVEADLACGDCFVRVVDAHDEDEALEKGWFLLDRNRQPVIRGTISIEEVSAYEAWEAGTISDNQFTKLGSPWPKEREVQP